MPLIRREPSPYPSRKFSPSHSTTTVIAPWFWQRKGAHADPGGNTRALGGLYQHTWLNEYPTDEYGPVRTWRLLGLIAFIHVGEGKKSYKHTPGWSLRFASIAPKLHFKKADIYV